MPLPDAGDFRVDIGNEALAEEYQDTLQRLLRQAVQHRHERRVAHVMHEALTQYVVSGSTTPTTRRQEGVSRQPRWQRVNEMVELLRVCNVTNSSTDERHGDTVSRMRNVWV